MTASAARTSETKTTTADHKGDSKPSQNQPSEIKIDYTQLTEFNPALVYGFDPEGMAQEPTSTFQAVSHMVNQHHDVYQAYLYAQNEILPAIKKLGGISKITPEQLIEWIKQIHLRIAKTMALDHHTVSGEYATQPIFRWHPDARIFDIWASALPALTEKNIVFIAQQVVHTYLVTASTHARNLHEAEKDISFESLGIAPEDLIDFLRLLLKIRDDKTIIIPKEIAPLRDNDIPTITFHRLFMQFHNNKLTEKEKILANKFVKFSSLPKIYPIKMGIFAKTLLATWSTCEANETDKIAKLARFAFYQLTEIHPFFNGNGRTATCLVNIILRSFGKPSILMRHIGERKDADTSYSKAIAEIKSKPETLIAHIAQRIASAEQKPYENKLHANVLMKRVEFYNAYIVLANYSPTFDINSFYNRVDKKAMKDIKMNPVMSPDELAALSMVLFDKIIPEFVKELESHKKKNTSHVLPSVTTRRYSAEEKAEIIKQIKKLTLRDDWKENTSNGFSLTFECNEDEADAFNTALKDVNAFVTRKMQAKDKRFFVRVDSFHLERLKSLESIPSLAAGAGQTPSGPKA